MGRKQILISVILFTAVIIILVIVLNPSHEYNKLIVNENKWKIIQESRVENRDLVLDDIEFNDYKIIIDEKNNTLYYSLVNDTVNKYNPNISYNANNENVNIALLDEITEEKVKSGYQFKIMIYNEKEYHIYNLKCTDLPILNISFNEEEEIQANNIPMEMYLFDNLSNRPNKITISSGKIKKNAEDYIFSLQLLTPGKNKRDNKISILNMKPNSEYVLTKVNSMKSYYPIDIDRQKNRVELFFNNEYIGEFDLGYIENKNFYR